MSKYLACDISISQFVWRNGFKGSLNTGDGGGNWDGAVSVESGEGRPLKLVTFRN